MSLSLSIQPCIIIIDSVTDKAANPLDCYVIVENIKYKVETPIKAVDISVKAFLF